MKITRLVVKNIGIIADATIEINRPLLIFYGECRAGKSTLLRAVTWVCGGAFPDDIIKHGAAEASIELGFDGGCVTRSWYRTKESEGKPSEIKARAVQFVRNGKPVPSPAAELKRLLNPFVLDQDFFRNKSELERKQYLAETFAVDTTALDSELFNVKHKAEQLRAKLTGYGDLDLTPVEKVDTAALQKTLADARLAHQGKIAAAQRQKAEKLVEWSNQAEAVSKQNAEITRISNLRNVSLKDIPILRMQIEGFEQEIRTLQAQIQKAKTEIGYAEQWLSENPAKEQIPAPKQPDTAELEAIIFSTAATADLESALQLAAATNVRAEQFHKNQLRDIARKADELALKVCEDRGRAIKKEKIAALSKVSETCGVPGLSFAEDGSFAFEGTAAGMLSTSQIMRLSSLLSALYPAELSLGIELCDRGESLGRSIFDYVKHAEAKGIAVLATVVGQKPAEIPAKVGVWVVRDGVVLKDDDEAALIENAEREESE